MGVLLLAAVVSGPGRLAAQSKSGDAPAKEPDWSVFRPSGTGQIQVGSYCTSCHDAKVIEYERRADAAGWQAIVSDMVFSKGAPAPEDDVPVMAAYLAKYFGPSTPKLELPVSINKAPKELLTLLPSLSEDDVQKLLSARRSAPVKDLSALEAVIGKEKAKGVKDYILFKPGFPV